MSGGGAAEGDAEEVDVAPLVAEAATLELANLLLCAAAGTDAVAARAAPLSRTGATYDARIDEARSISLKWLGEREREREKVRDGNSRKTSESARETVHFFPPCRAKTMPVFSSPNFIF